jgi:hypothetical protein
MQCHNSVKENEKKSTNKVEWSTNQCRPQRHTGSQSQLWGMPVHRWVRAHIGRRPAADSTCSPLCSYFITHPLPGKSRHSFLLSSPWDPAQNPGLLVIVLGEHLAPNWSQEVLCKCHTQFCIAVLSFFIIFITSRHLSSVCVSPLCCELCILVPGIEQASDLHWLNDWIHELTKNSHTMEGAVLHTKALPDCEVENMRCILISNLNHFYDWITEGSEVYLSFFSAHF